MREITVKEFIDAIRKNGLPQAFKQFYTDDDKGNIIAACAIGQADINLHIRNIPHRITSIGFMIHGDVMRLNDDLYMPLESIADDLENRYTAIFDDIMYKVS